jgi:hypothetical protein
MRLNTRLKYMHASSGTQYCMCYIGEPTYNVYDERYDTNKKLAF